MSTQSWSVVLRDLLARGLHGVQYVVSDEHVGLRAALAAELLTELLTGLRNVWAAPTLAEARRRLRITNALEREHEEIRRRTRVIRIFPNAPTFCDSSPPSPPTGMTRGASGASSFPRPATSSTPRQRPPRAHAPPVRSSHAPRQRSR